MTWTNWTYLKERDSQPPCANNLFKMASFLNAIAGLFLLMILPKGAAPWRAVVTPPENVTARLGEIAQFKCEVVFAVDPVMHWEFNHETVYTYEFGQEIYPLGNIKYSVEQDGRTFELTVKDLQNRDGGQYTCSVPDQAEAANLMVIGAPQLFNSTPIPVEGSSVEYICTALIGGPSEGNISPEQYPQLQMFFDGEPLNGPVTVVANNLGNGTAFYDFTQKYNITLEPVMDGKQLMCIIGTSNSTVNETVTFEIAVLYYVRNIDYNPHGEQFEVGTIINCTADGNPAPNFVWNDTQKTGNVVLGHSLEVTEEMIGSNAWRCTALNTINGIVHEDSVVVDFQTESPVNGKISSDAWKIAITVPFCIAIGCLIVWYFRCRRRRSDWISLIENTEMLERESVRYKEQGIPCEVMEDWIDPNDDIPHVIELENVIVEVPPKAMGKPVMISVTQRDISKIRQRQIKSEGIDDVLKPVIQLSLQPIGLKLAEPVKLSVKRKWPEKSSFMIFNNLKDKWTDITSESSIEVTEDGIKFTIRRFAHFEIFVRSAVRQAKEASELANNMLNSGNVDGKEVAAARYAEQNPDKGYESRYEELLEVIGSLKSGKDLEATITRRIKELLNHLNGKIRTQGSSALIQLIEKAPTLIWSDHFVDVTEALVEKHTSIWHEKQEDPLRCLVELLQNDSTSTLTQHPEKLIKLIVVLLQLDGSADARSSCVRVLIMNSKEWRQHQGKPTAKENTSSRMKQLQWNPAFINVLKELVQNGADPAWSPEGSSEGSNLHLFVVAVKELISLKSKLLDNIMDSFKVMMTESSLDFRNTDSEGLTILHTLVDGKTKPIFPENTEKLLQIISQVKTKNSIILDSTNNLKHTPLHTFVSSVLAVKQGNATETDTDVFTEAAKQWAKDKDACVRVIKSITSANNINLQCKVGRTPLHYFVESALDYRLYPEEFSAIVDCLKSTSNINIQDEIEETPLHIMTSAAAEWINYTGTFLRAVNCLVSESNINLQNRDKITPLMKFIIAAGEWKDHPDTFLEVLKCLKSNSNIDLHSKNKSTPLLNFTIKASAKWQDCPDSFLEVVKFLRSPLNIDFQDEEGFIPLHNVTAAAGEWKDHPDTFLEVLKCLKSDSNIDLHTKDKTTPLLNFTIKASAKWKDCPNSFLEVVKCLISPCNIDFYNEGGWTPLHGMTPAAGEWKDHPDIFLEVLKCLKSDSNINLRDMEEVTPILNFIDTASAIWTDCPDLFLEVVKFLRSPLNIDFQDEQGFIPLHDVTAAAGEWKDHPDIFLEILKCLKSNSNIDLCNKYKATPLLNFTTAASAKWKDCPDSFLHVAKFLRSPLNVDMQNENGDTPLHEITFAAGAWVGHSDTFLEVVKCLRSEINIEFQNRNGCVTPLLQFTRAAKEWAGKPHMFLDVVKFLKSSSNVSLADQDGNTALVVFTKCATNWKRKRRAQVAECLKNH